MSCSLQVGTVDRVAQLAHQRDELGQPGVQALVENFVDAGVAQTRIYSRRHTLRGTAGRPRQLGEDLVDFFGAGAQGTRDICPATTVIPLHAARRNVTVDLGVGLEG